MNNEVNNESGLAMASGSSIHNSISSDNIPSIRWENPSVSAHVPINLVSSKSSPNSKNAVNRLKTVIWLETFCIAFGFMAFYIAIMLLSGGCGPKVVIDLNDYSKALDQCKAQGKDAGSYPVYESCAKEADIKYGRTGEK